MIMSRRQQGSADKVEVPVPEGVMVYNGYMGGVDELDRHRCGDHGFEGRGRAFKWTNRFFDSMVNMLCQASYRIYKYCRDKKEGNEPSLLHSEFNEIVIDHLLNNAAWKMEKELLATGKRASIRKLTESSDVYQNVEINFKESHDLELCKEVYDGTKRVEGEEEEKDGEEVEKDDSPSSWPPAAAPKSSSTSSSTSISNSS